MTQRASPLKYNLDLLIKFCNENHIEGLKHRHFVDIFIPSQNKCIEVKSTWTAEKRRTIYSKNNKQESI